jgi:hypothetical protein
MKKTLLQVGLCLFTLALNAQSRLHKIEGETTLNLQNSIIKKKTIAKNLLCQDTLRYAEVKEQTLSVTPTYYYQTLFRSDNEEISMAYLSSFSNTIHGIEFLARRSEYSSSTGAVVQVSIYSSSQSFEPNTLIGSATITITDEVNFDYYVANFPVPLTVTGNYCVVVKPITTNSVIDLIINDVNVSSYDELFCRFKSDYYASSSSEWIAIPSFTEYVVSPANFEPLVAPIVSYNLGTQINAIEQIICKNEILTLNAEITPNGIYGNRFYNYYSFWANFNSGTIDSTLNWQTPNSVIGSSSSGTQTTVQYNSVAQHQITLINNLGFYSSCLDQDNIVITISEPNTSAGNDITICAGEPVTLNASGADSYNWNNNVSNGVPFTTTISGVYTVEGTDSLGCMKTDVLTITVNPLPNTSAGNDITICAGEPVTLNASGADSYNWNNNVSNGVQFTVTSTDTYVVEGTNSLGCMKADSLIITVNSLPTVSLAAFNSICDTAGIVNLTGGSPAGGTYSGISVSNNAFNTSIGVGTYPITYSYTNNNNCSASSLNDLTVIECSNVGLSEEITGNFLLYPNPANDNLILEASNDLLGREYNIFDFSGRIIIQGKINTLTQKIEITNISNGSYLFEIENASKNSIKFVKM